MMGAEPMADSRMTGVNRSYSVHSVEEWSQGKSSAYSDCVVEEVPVALEFNRVSHAVMLATPQGLEDFAIGFSLTENIIDKPGDIHDLQIVQDPLGIILRLTVAQHCFKRLREKRRNLTGRTGCGLCGAQNLEQVVREQPVVNSTAKLTPLTLQIAFEQIRNNQPLMCSTGASHAAAWLDAEGKVAWIREDVGRHNALDKLLGALVRNGIDLSTGAVLITSRASYEMVQKSASLGVGILAAISAPTGLAIRLAQSSGMTLAGFVRRDRLIIYAHGQRIQEETGGVLPL
jgi:FdhD protein